MSEALNIVKASFGGLREVATAPLWQWDYGQILRITGLDLPQAFEVHFSNSRKSGETITQIGTNGAVTIPDMYLTSGADIYAFIFLHDGTDDGETEYVIKIPVRERPEPSDIEPTPEQQDAITEAIAVLDDAVEQTGEDKAATAALSEAAAASSLVATEAAQSAQGSATSASASASTASTAAATATAKASEAATSAANAASAKTSAEAAQSAAETAQAAAEAAAASIAPVDPTLSITGRAADAKATGDRLDSLTEMVGGKQDTLTFDDAPTSGSVNPVKSGGVYAAVDTKVSKPLTNPTGTNGQLLRTLGNGQTEWVDQGLPTDEQTAQAVSDWLDDHPEATTTVQDGAITLSKLNESLVNTVVVTQESEKSYSHNQNPTKVTVYPNQYTQNIPVRYAGGECLLSSADARTSSINGITTVKDGRFYNITGTTPNSAGLSLFVITDAVTLAKFAGKTVKFCMYIKMTNSWANDSYFAIYVNDSTMVLKPYYSSFSAWNVWTVQFPAELTKIYIYFHQLKDTVFAQGDFIWFGFYEANPVVTDTVVTTDPAEISVSGLSKIDTMMHESEINYVVPTKDYVDEHTPDIIGYWTENVYVMPENFGAVGDGVTDDAQALADCIDYAVANNKAVRGFRRYKTSESVVLDEVQLDVYLREVIYSGNSSAVKIQNNYIDFEFHKIQSNGDGIEFSKNSGGTAYARQCKINGNTIQSNGDCIVAQVKTLYNECDVKYLASSNGNCITFSRPISDNEFEANEYIFRSCSCACPNGYVAHTPTASKFYDFTVEGNCKYGIVNPMDSICVGWRHAEQTDSTKLRINGYDDRDNGALIIFTDRERLGRTGSFKFISTTTLPFYAIDLSALNNYSGAEDSSEWHLLSYKGIDIGTPVRGGNGSAYNIIGNKVYIIGGHKVLCPEGRKKINVDIATCDFRLLESQTDEDILSAFTIANYMGTDFVIGVSHADIYFNASFGAIGYNDITLTQANGKTATIYDKLGNVLFDGTNEGDGVWSFKCIMDRSSMGRYQGFTNWWCYDGTNEFWEIEQIS